MVHRAEIHRARRFFAPDLSRLFVFCVWTLLFATFGASVVLLRSPFFHPLSSGCNSHHNSAAAVAKSFAPAYCFNSGAAPKVSREGQRRAPAVAGWPSLAEQAVQQSATEGDALRNSRRGFIDDLIGWLGARSQPCIARRTRGGLPRQWARSPRLLPHLA